MLLIDAKNIKKSFGERILFEIKDLKIYAKDKVGIIGKNGSGKTTLINILQNRDHSYEGSVKIYGSFSYITQLGGASDNQVSSENISKYNLIDKNVETMSGGELTKLKIAGALTNDQHILFADEPTCNLDLNAIKELEEKINKFDGAVILISHDKLLLDAVCNKIIEIEDGKVTEYTGNYTDYIRVKDERKQRQHVEYEQYVKERKRLEKAMVQKSTKAKKLKKTPSRMGISEARLHRRATGAKKAKIEKNALAIKKRIEQMEKKEKPKIFKETKISIPDYLKVHAKKIVSIDSISKSFGDRHLFSCENISIKNNKKTGILGDNGTGKTTLLEMIYHGYEGISVPRQVRFGYFKQNLKNLEEEMTILDNVMSTTWMKEEQVRTVLGRLLFRKEDVFKKIKLLSGGERVKVSFAKIFLSHMNVLLMDEPTNYLDIESRNAIMSVLMDYEGPVIFVSHDREFIQSLADEVVMIEDENIKHYPYGYAAVLEKRMDQPQLVQQEDHTEEIMQLENRLNYLIGMLSIPDPKKDMGQLDKEYYQVLQQLKRLREEC